MVATDGLVRVNAPARLEADLANGRTGWTAEVPAQAKWTPRGAPDWQ